MRDFRELYSLYSKQLYNYLFFLTNNSFEAEELVQETFYQAFKSIYRFNGDSSVKTWLYQIGKNVYYKHQRKNTAQHTEFDPNHKSFTDFSSPDKILEKEEQEKILHQSISQLKEPYKQIVILRSFNELSFKEIGDIFQMSENWARVNFHRGKQTLGEFLKRGNGV